MKQTGTLTAAEAAEALGVSRETLYAYVSRNLIRSEVQEGTRARGYRAEDVWSLLQRREARRHPLRAGEEALRRDDPVIESSLTLAADGGLFYRGRDVLELATSHTIEQAAMLLWTGDARAPFPSPPRAPLPPDWATLRRVAAGLSPVEAFQLVLPAVSAHDAAGYDLSPAAVRRTGARTLRLFAGLAVGRAPSQRRVTDALQRGWAPQAREVRRLLEAVLVLWADDDLDCSTLVARCVASSQANPYAAVNAALCALPGGAIEQVEALFDEVDDPRRVRRVLEARLRRGETLPGFGHPFHPDGDPRAKLLLRLLREARPGSHALALTDALAGEGSELVERRPNGDFALVALCRGLGLPEGSPMALMAIARSVGWIAHALEQYAQGRGLRPRVRYLGLPPRSHAPRRTRAAG